MDRAQLQQLAELRVQDAEALLTVSRWDAAYYLLGYAIECALKACVAKQFRLHEVPDKELVNSFYTHSFDRLLAISGVKSNLEIRRKVDTRYEAVTNSATGILPWLKTQW